MTRDRDIERTLEHWLVEGADEMPDRVYRTIFDRVERQPQAVAPRLLRRLPAMTPTTRLLAVAAVAVAIGAIGLFAAGRPSETPIDPSPSPTVSPTGIPGATANEAILASWIGETRPIAELGPGQDRSFLDLQPPVAMFHTGVGAYLHARVEPVGADRIRFISVNPGDPCTTGDVGTYYWTLSRGGTLLTITADGVDNCSVRTDAVEGTWTRSACLDPDNSCLGAVEAGTYRSTFFEPFGQPAGSVGAWKMQYGQISYRLPAGWANASDWPNAYDLLRESDYISADAGGPAPPGIFLLSAPGLAATDCSEDLEPGVETTIAATAAGIATRPGLIVTETTDIVIGDRSGLMFDVQLDPAWTETCPEMDGAPTVPFLREVAGDWGWHLTGVERARVILLDVAEDRTMAIIIDEPGTPANFTPFVAGAMPIVESIEFHPPTD